MLWWYKIWQHSGYNHSCAKQKLLRRPRRSLMKFLEPTRKPKVIYTDNSLEFGKSCEELILVSLFVNTTQIRNTRDCRKNHTWSERNIQDLLSDGKTPYERRFGMPFNGPVIPFGAMVEYHPISAKDRCSLHRGESGKETSWSQTLKNWRRWTHQNS